METHFGNKLRPELVSAYNSSLNSDGFLFRDIYNQDYEKDCIDLINANWYK